jgi:rRNA maturation protein Rpf1
MSSLYITTSRKPSALARKLIKILAIILHAKRENRGKRSLDEVVARAENFGRRRVAVIFERNGNPYSLNFYEDGWLEPEVRMKSFKIFSEKEKKKGQPKPGLSGDGNEDDESDEDSGDEEFGGDKKDTFASRFPQAVKVSIDDSPSSKRIVELFGFERDEKSGLELKIEKGAMLFSLNGEKILGITLLQ